MEKTLGSFVRARRQELGLSQTELGARAGMKQGVISLIETGAKNRLRKEQVQAIAETLECTAGEIRDLLKPCVVAQPRTEFGRLFRQRRETMGLSIPALAEIAGMTKAAIRQLELRKSPRIKITTAVKFGTILKTDFARFVGHRPGRKLSPVGEIIRTRMLGMGISADQLAGRLGITPQHLNHLELGNSGMSRKLKDSLAEKLGVSIEILDKLQPQTRRKPKVKQKKCPTIVGGAINKKRSRLNLSIPDLAASSGLSTTTIYNAEMGVGRVSRKTLGKLEKVLGKIGRA